MLKVEIAYKRMYEFQSLMLEDIRTARDFGLNDSSQYSLRTIYRTGAAYIEGIIYQLRLVCLAAVEDMPDIFSHNEIQALREKSIFLSIKGRPEEKDAFQKIQPSILFTFSLFAKMHRVEFTPCTNDHRWGSLREFISIRNSLMHPKSISDFEINEDKNKVCVEAVSWFQENFKALVRACEEADIESK